MSVVSWLCTEQGILLNLLYVYKYILNGFYRLKEFDDVLQNDIIDLKALRNLSFNGAFVGLNSLERTTK